MMPTTSARTERSPSAVLTIDLLVAILVALLLAATARGASPATGLAASENFTIWADSQQQADAVLARAEVWRERIAREWLGQPLSAGAGRASLNIRLSDRDAAYAWLAAEPADAGHLVWICTTTAKLDTALAHEIAHVVLATESPELPAFVQEGIAGQYDDGERCALRRAVIEGCVRSGRWPSLIDVLKARSIAPADRRTYAVAVSLTEFLLAYDRRENGTTRTESVRGVNRPNAASRARVLFDFAAEGSRTGAWDAAAAHHYGLAGVRGLESAWREWSIRSVRAEMVQNRAGAP